MVLLFPDQCNKQNIAFVCLKQLKGYTEIIVGSASTKYGVK